MLGLGFQLCLVPGCRALAGLRVLKVQAIPVSSVFGNFRDLGGHEGRGRTVLCACGILVDACGGAEPVVTAVVIVFGGGVVCIFQIGV